jgi:tetratricopeptide (TPR) repeat protein
VDFDFQWLLIGLPIAFALGWLASRIDLRQVRRDSRDAPRAYFTGLNLLLNEQQDKAIDAFIEAVQNDPDTTDLHFALGNLFRRRGEFERAVRVHQHLLQRGDLPAAERDRAQHALAQDFMKAGLFDRAEAAYAALEGSAFDGEAKLALLSLYERSRDWQRAAQMAERLQQAGGASFASRIAHFWCELALEADQRGDRPAADAALSKALEVAPQAARAHVLQGQRLADAGEHAQAVQAWDELRRLNPGAFLLVAQAYAHSGAGLAGAVRPASGHRPVPRPAGPGCCAAAAAAPAGPSQPVRGPGLAVPACRAVERRRRRGRSRGGRSRSQAFAALPLRRLRLRGPALLLAVPGLPQLGQLSAAAGGRAVAGRAAICCSSRRITSSRAGLWRRPPTLATRPGPVMPARSGSWSQ